MAEKVKEKNYYEIGSAVDMTPFIKRKNSANFISWSDEYNQVRKLFPNMSYKVWENAISQTKTDENGVKTTQVFREPFFKTQNGNSAFVKLSVILDENTPEVCEIYPIMDYKNKSIPAEQVTMTDVNKAIQRGLTKCLCRASGCGLYIYSGSDLPQETKEVNELQSKVLELIMKKSKTDALKEKVGKICKEMLPEENGDPRLCDSTDTLEKLRRKLMAVR